MIVCGVLLGALILAVMGYALASIQEIVFSGIFIGAIPAVGGVALIVYAIRRGLRRPGFPRPPVLTRYPPAPDICTRRRK